MKKTRLILVGGFLGAGKTTLLYEVSKKLMQNGQRIGLITNDQAPELVDTALLLQTNLKVAELSGSCFCCNFNGFIDAIQNVNSGYNADLIIAEPVGSCTDLSATIMQPLKEYQKAELLISPLTVLADPSRLNEILEGGTAGLHPSAAYIFEKQLEESDLILISKTDLLTEEEKLKAKVKLHYPASEVLTVSSKTGKGLDAWLQKIQNSEKAGKRIIEVDYDRYAEGESVLGWLNATMLLRGKNTDWNKFADNFLSSLARQCDEQKWSVGHIKIMLEAGTEYLIGNITGSQESRSIRGNIPKGNTAKLIINARVGTTPVELEKLVKETLVSNSNELQLETKAWKCLSPGYPTPTYKFTRLAK